MRLLLIPLLLAFILFLGCFGSSAPPAPPYKAPTKSNGSVALPPVNNASAGTPPAPHPTPVVPPKNATRPSGQTPNGSQPPNPNPANQGAPANSSPSQSNATATSSNATQNSAPTPSSVCGGSGDSAMLECIAQAAIAQKDVLICTQLTSQADRYKCFTRWCYSGARDYKQCQSLPDNDDRLGCLNKCNPNFNT